MKIKVYVDRMVEVEIDNPTIEKLVELHRANPLNSGTAEEYQTAMECIEKATGIPMYDEYINLSSDHILAAYAEDSTPIFEC